MRSSPGPGFGISMSWTTKAPLSSGRTNAFCVGMSGEGSWTTYGGVGFVISQDNRASFVICCEASALSKTQEMQIVTYCRAYMHPAVGVAYFVLTSCVRCHARNIASRIDYGLIYCDSQRTVLRRRPGSPPSGNLSSELHCECDIGNAPMTFHTYVTTLTSSRDALDLNRSLHGKCGRIVSKFLRCLS